nr:transglycosylase family protein [Streptomyces sp. SID3343]
MRIIGSAVSFVLAGAVSAALVVGVAAPAHAASDQTWDLIADCESSGRWDLDTGNGYYGGLQILPSTWNEAGGQAYATRPDLATRDEQIVVAEQIQLMQGWDAWPQCARQIGLIGAAYTVKPGDTLTSIARDLGVIGGWEALYAANRDAIGPDPDLLLPGTVLNVPKAARRSGPRLMFTPHAPGRSVFDRSWWG